MEERARRNQKLVANFSFAVVGWAPAEVKAIASVRGHKITLEEAVAILTDHERLIKAAMECAGRD
jgi:hypothetical protein